MSDVKNSGLATGLVTYLELEEASGTRVDSHGSNDFADNNTVGSGTGIQGTAADFESNNTEYLTKSLGSTGLELSTTFSVQVWFKAESLPGFMGIYMSGDNANIWRIGVSSGTPKFTFTEDNIADYPGTTTLTTGTWYHGVIVKDGDSGTNLTIYLNGVPDGTYGVGTVATPATQAVIGAYNNADGAGYRLGFDGLIDEFAIWNRALTSTEVTTLYNSGAGIPYDAGGAAPTFIPKVSMFN